MAQSVSLGTLGRPVPGGSHIRTFFNGPAGRDEFVMPFLAVDTLRAHPMVIVDGMIHENPH
jgi:hypothetical protein